MTESASPAKTSSKLVLAAVSALLLASCSTTSEPLLAVALQPPTPSLAAAAPASGIAASAGGAEQTASDAIAEAGATTAYSFVGDGDPVLPQTVAAVPAPSPLQPRIAYAASASPATPSQSEIDAVIDSRAGPASETPAQPALEAAAEPAAPAPAPQKKRGFFASLFGADQQAASPSSVPAAAPQPAPQPQLAAAQTPQPDAEPAAIAGTMASATAFIENRPPEAALAPKKRGMLASLFTPAQAAPGPQQRPEARAAAAPLVQLASTGPVVQIDTAAPRTLATATLPGVRTDNLFEITRKSGIGDNSDIDLHEDDDIEVASAAGLARLAPNGLLKQTDRVDVQCLKPSLLRVIKTIEDHYGRKAVVTSGYRSPPTNRRARGATNSLHMYCAAADIQIQGVSKWELASYLRSMPGRGGVGTYCHTNSVHVDVGPERDWDWRCRKRKK